MTPLFRSPEGVRPETIVTRSPVPLWLPSSETMESNPSLPGWKVMFFFAAPCDDTIYPPSLSDLTHAATVTCEVTLKLLVFETLMKSLPLKLIPKLSNFVEEFH